MRVRWTTQAEQDRLDIMTYIAGDNVRAAIAMDELFGEAASRLEEFPMIGKPGLVAGTRELIPHESYRLIYEVDEPADTVWVLALIHTARQWPPVRR
ncbi:MAG TPA: type II toxin-antitoxin system RelE/ParE family toxin [Burkholderiaceae bacterium]|nr:type II toxin-antitoxin system RelE/ParE family toxin [Burkholderiaceae bacterium]